MQVDRPQPAGPPAPSIDRTYRLANGDTIDGNAWVDGLPGWFEYGYNPVELVEEVWERTSVRRFWLLPDPFGSCDIEDEELCDEDATCWWSTDSTGDPAHPWLRVCDRHAALLPPEEVHRAH